MNPISHEKARQYLHRQREALESSQRQAMEAHLFICEDCRKYGRNLALLERELSRNFHNRLDPVPTPTGIAGEVKVRLDRTTRTRRNFSLAGSLGGGLVLVLLLLILIQLFLGSPPPAVDPMPTMARTEGMGEFTGGPQESPNAVEEPLPVSSGRLIAFTSRRGGNEEIYVMNIDGSGQANLTNHPAEDHLPAWSPDGQQLAFVSDRSGKPEVYRMNFDGTGLVQLTDLPYAAGFWALSWSPDGASLAAEVQLTHEVTGELFGRIFLIRADGSGVQDLTRNELPIRTYEPKWSPAGEWIAYVRGGQAPNYLRMVRPDGTEDTKINLSVRNTRAYTWSPDGSRIAYITSCSYCELYDDDPPDLRLFEIDGSEPATLIRFEDLSLDFFNLSWSPDGSYLAFTANVGGESVRHLYLLDGRIREMVDVASFEPGDWFISFLSWSPDGARLVLDAGREEERDIYVVDLEDRLGGEEGEGITNLTPDSPGMDYQPQWQP